MVRSGADYLRRAVRQPGYERDDLLLVAKSVAAAVGAWALAAWLLPHVTTAFAPFTALLAVRATVYRSLRDGAQYLVAVLIGVSLVAESFDQHIPKGYIYFAMAFSVMVELLNLKARGRKAEPVHLRHVYTEETPVG